MDISAVNHTLESIGIENWSAYQKSPLFESIRKRALQRDNHRCAHCNERATTIRHLDFTRGTLIGHSGRLKHIESNCAACHTRFTTPAVTPQRPTVPLPVRPLPRFVPEGSRRLSIAQYDELLKLGLDGDTVKDWTAERAALRLRKRGRLADGRRTDLRR